MASFIESWIARLLFSTISLTAFLGNSLVILVFVKKRKIYLQKPFEILILNLAVSDVLAAVFLVFTRFLYVAPMPRGQLEAYLFCTLLWGSYIVFALGYISIYTCVLLTIERWMAIVRPQHYQRFKKKQAFVIVIFIWIWGFLLNTPAFLNAEQDLANNKCRFVDIKIGKTILPVLQLLFTCFLPFITIICLYTHIFYKMNRMSLFLQGTVGIVMKKRLTVIALVATAMLVIGWLPTQISYMLDLALPNNSGASLDSTLYYVFIMMTLVNSCVNPVLYGVCSSRCRKEYMLCLRGILACFFRS